ncbi:hypothetical protein SAPIO_CDS3148 [Scedosporium apiospermum]|uniref:Uncharacterized protein n=1 Tax=Pseudallescheria apiosperma TaxID=563466 RepID=A0A084GA52_PSEDA|nr:uncharacterized protein SAPIO_CDS3148 [Scedosporium apiospermum]KEZ44214.1 hypothetical protein SAPIO_CDS3148 [Scedosporium apiospermum]
MMCACLCPTVSLCSTIDRITATEAFDVELGTDPEGLESWIYNRRLMKTEQRPSLNQYNELRPMNPDPLTIPYITSYDLSTVSSNPSTIPEKFWGAMQKVLVVGNATFEEMSQRYRANGELSRRALREFKFFVKLEAGVQTQVKKICRPVPPAGDLKALYQEERALLA